MVWADTMPSSYSRTMTMMIVSSIVLLLGLRLVDFAHLRKPPHSFAACASQSYWTYHLTVDLSQRMLQLVPRITMPKELYPPGIRAWGCASRIRILRVQPKRKLSCSVVSGFLYMLAIYSL